MSEKSINEIALEAENAELRAEIATLKVKLNHESLCHDRAETAREQISECEWGYKSIADWRERRGK